LQKYRKKGNAFIAQSYPASVEDVKETRGKPHPRPRGRGRTEKGPSEGVIPFLSGRTGGRESVSRGRIVWQKRPTGRTSSNIDERRRDGKRKAREGLSSIHEGKKRTKRKKKSEYASIVEKNERDVDFKTAWPTLEGGGTGHRNHGGYTPKK